MVKEEGVGQEPVQSSREALLEMLCGTWNKPQNLSRLGFLVYKVMITDHVSSIDFASSVVL